MRNVSFKKCQVYNKPRTKLFNDFRHPDTGVSVVVTESDGSDIYKATITYWNSGIGVNVTANEQMLSVTTILPPGLKVSDL